MGGIEKIGQIEGSHKENNYSQDQISMGDSGFDIFSDFCDTAIWTR